jgi:hypothetical protein
VTEGRILDLLADACARYRLEGDRGIDWTVMHMSSADRLAFDLFLVRTRDPLAFEVGTVEHRFTTRMRRPVRQRGLRAPMPTASALWSVCGPCAVRTSPM